MTGKAKMGALGAAAAIAVGCAKHEASPVAADVVAAKQSTRLTVTTDAVSAQGKVLVEFTAAGAGKTPTLYWKGVPATTKEIEVLVEDPDAPGEKPFVHLLLEGLSPTATSSKAPGLFGPNSAGKEAYAPFDPPAGPPHRYVFQVLALDELLPDKPTGRDRLLAEIAGHVLAKGEVAGTFGK